MYTYKQFLSREVNIAPIVLNKNFKFDNNNILNNIGGGVIIPNVDFLHGINLNPNEINFWDESKNPLTGFDTETSEEYTRYNKGQIYKSIIQLYKLYKTFYLEDRFLNLDFKEIPEEIFIISISPETYGEKIFQKSFKLIYEGNIYLDDGFGNIYLNDDFIGNIFYKKGIIVLYKEKDNYKNLFLNPDSEYSKVELEFSSTIIIREHNYICKINPSEFKYSLNPTLVKSNSDEYVDFINKPYFSPYITTVGLYNDNKELLAVAKLANPIPSSKFMETNLIIKFDE